MPVEAAANLRPGGATPRARWRRRSGGHRGLRQPGADALRQQRHPPERRGDARGTFRCARASKAAPRAPPPTAWTPTAIRAVVEQAIALTRLTEPDDESLPLAEPAEYRDVDRWHRGHRADQPAGAGARRGRSHPRGGIGGPDRGRNLLHRRHRVHPAELARRPARTTARPWRDSPSPPWPATAPDGPRPAPAIAAT